MLDNVASSGPGRLRRVRSKIQSYRGVPPLVVIAGSTYEISGHFPHRGPTGFNSRFTSIYPITANRQVVLPCSRDSERGEKGICWYVGGVRDAEEKMHQLLKPLRSLTNATVLAEPRTLSGDGLKRSRLRVGKLPSQAGNRAVWCETRHELHSEQM